jgi:hypothetical protein
MGVCPLIAAHHARPSVHNVSVRNSPVSAREYTSWNTPTCPCITYPCVTRQCKHMYTSTCMPFLHNVPVFVLQTRASFTRPQAGLPDHDPSCPHRRWLPGRLVKAFCAVQTAFIAQRLRLDIALSIFTCTYACLVPFFQVLFPLAVEHCRTGAATPITTTTIANRNTPRRARVTESSLDLCSYTRGLCHVCMQRVDHKVVR